jgi:hypothetical protein
MAVGLFDCPVFFDVVRVMGRARLEPATSAS